MAGTVNPTWEDVGGDGNAKLWTWALTSAAETGIAIEQVQGVDICWQATGDFGSTGVMAAQGSNTNTDANFGATTNASGGSAITFSAAGGPKQQVERPRFIRPKLTTVGTNAAVSVTCLVRKNPVK